MLYSAKNKKLIVTFLGVLFIVASAVSGTFAWLYNVTKQNVLSKWQNDTAQFAQSVSHYFKMSEDAVAISAETLNDMLFTGKSNEEALTYLRNETEIYSAVISDNETGVYSFFRGEYLDGSGWIPDDDYEPKKRPWYTAAMESAGNIAFAHPYLNLQTQTLMISVSRLLDDGESVVSMDIFLDSIQAMAEKMITTAKTNTLHNRRLVLAFVTKEDVVSKLFSEIAPKYADRNGGYTRVTKIGPRRGDGAEMAVIELV